MLWVKAFHIVFVASWFAGLFYLPRIFVNLAMVAPGSVAERERLLLMARKLLRFTTLLAVPALALGLWLFLGYGIGRGPGSGWMHAKLAVVVLVMIPLRMLRALACSSASAGGCAVTCTIDSPRSEGSAIQLRRKGERLKSVKIPRHARRRIAPARLLFACLKEIGPYHWSGLRPTGGSLPCEPRRFTGSSPPVASSSI